jgi:hypothetical protein
MKKMINKMVLGLALVASLVAVVAPAQAKSKKQAPIALNIEPTIKFIANDGGSSTFNVKFNSEKAINFELIIKNEEGSVLYSQQFETANFSKFVKFVHDSDDEVNAIFTIRDLSTGAEQSYTTASTTTTVRTVAVTKL